MAKKLQREGRALVCGMSLVVPLFACSPSAPAGAPNIVLICFDTLRADHMSVYGYSRDTTPQIARYFRNAEVFERAYTAATYTPASVVSMLSGLYPAAHGVRDFYQRIPRALRILPDHLAKLGYQTAAIVSNTVLTDEALGLAGRFETYDDFVDERELNRNIYERRASRTADAAIRWLAVKRDPARPHFLLLHFNDPHAPYRPPEDEVSTRFTHEGSRPLEEEAVKGYQRLPGVVDALDYVDRYDEEIAYADRELGRFLATYEKLGLLDDAILIFTADHGETLLEHDPNFSHRANLWSEVLRVPLLIRWPGARETRRRSDPVSLIDIGPTLLQAVGGEALPGVAGISLAERREGDVLLQEGWVSTRKSPRRPRRRSLIRHGRKWTFQRHPEGALSELWYSNLDADPNESDPQPWPGDAQPVRQLIGRIVAAEPEAGQSGEPEPGFRLGGPKVAPELEAHQLEALRALGYVE